MIIFHNNIEPIMTIRYQIMRKLFKLEYLLVIPLTCTLIIIIVFPIVYLYFFIMVIINNIILLFIILFTLPILLYFVIKDHDKTLTILSYIFFWIDISIYMICYINFIITPFILLYNIFLYPPIIIQLKLRIQL